MSALEVIDESSIPEEPPPDSFYKHRSRLVDSVKSLWAAREIIFTLAERDLRAQYEQASLGMLWALFQPLATLAVFTIIFSHQSHNGYGIPGVAYGLFAYPGILVWTFFTQALGTGGVSLVRNNNLLSKTQFPRECFPLQTLIVAAINTALSCIPLVLLFIVYGKVPHLEGLWTVALVPIEVAYTAGLSLGISALVIQMRDLAQVLPVVLNIGIFATPVFYATSKIPVAWQAPISFINPLVAIIQTARRTMLMGSPPAWGPLLGALAGAVFFLAVGYKIFKRFEVNFADLA